MKLIDPLIILPKENHFWILTQFNYSSDMHIKGNSCATFHLTTQASGCHFRATQIRNTIKILIIHKSCPTICYHKRSGPDEAFYC